jgi:NAD(P)-dependent dehydrogenase (short-subunit alcohol dehydrogenase family)
MARFINKVVIVSGAGSVGPGWGNGRAIAVQMVEEGAHVLALDRELARMDETLSLAQKAALTSGGSIEALACDVTVSDAIKACVDHAMARWGRIDVLVNNVGGSAAGGPVEMSEAVETCCGFGGTFATKHAAVSTAMGEVKCAAAVASGAEVVVSNDASCLMHLRGLLVRQGVPLQTLHLAEVLVQS